MGFIVTTSIYIQQTHDYTGSLPRVFLTMMQYLVTSAQPSYPD